MPKVFSKLFTLRSLEQVGVAALSAFSGVLASAGVSGTVDKAVVLLAVAAAARAAYGVAVAKVGEPDAPQVK